MIGYRAYRMTGEHVERIGLYGFGSAAHLIAQIALHEGRQVYAFTRRADDPASALASPARLGAGGSARAISSPRKPLDAAIIFALGGRAGSRRALRALAPGGTVVCAGIHMTDIPSFAYEDLWHERSIRSVANLTRQDGVDLLDVVARVPLQVETTTYPLEATEQALADLRAGAFTGSAVITVGK